MMHIVLKAAFRLGVAVVASLCFHGVAFAASDHWPNYWNEEWPKTDFSQHSVPYAEILSGGPPKDGIPSIDRPIFNWVKQTAPFNDLEPVISVVVGHDARAYPLRILTWHEIVNDMIGGLAVAITYCPLCNAGVVFERTLRNGRVLDFGTTGKLRKSDMIMYDRQTESWWQQFSGEAIVGALLGTTLVIHPSRLESYALFRKRHPEGRILTPNDPSMRPYGTNPYVGYDRVGFPSFYRGEMPKDIAPMARVVVVGKAAWSFDLLRSKNRIETPEYVIEWTPGQVSALDNRDIAKGRDVGNVTVRQKTEQGLTDAVHHVTFAFVFHAFEPGGVIYKP